MYILLETLADLWRLLDRRGRVLALGLVVLLIITGMFEMGAIVFLFGYIGALSETGSGNPVEDLYRGIGGGLEGRAFALAAGVLLLFVFLMKNVTGLLTSFLLLRFSMKRFERVSEALYAGYLGTRLELWQQKGTAGARQVLASAGIVFRGSFNAALSALSDIAIIVTILLTLLFVLDARFVLIGGLVIGLGGYSFVMLTRSLSETLGRRQLEAQKTTQMLMQEGFGGLIDIRLGDRRETMVSRYVSAVRGFTLADRRSAGLRSVPRAANEVLLATGIVMAAVYFAGRPGGMQAALPTLAVAGFAGLRVTAAVSRLTAALQQMRERREERRLMMTAIRETAPAILLGEAATSPDDYLHEDRPLPAGVSGRLEDRIAVDDVSFTYPDADLPAIDHVSLEIPRGHFVGFCGPSGGGKSTLARLIMGLIRPDTGTIRCDGWDIFRHLRAWHANIGHVGQTVYIAPRNVRENVAFGYEPREINDQAVWRALELARLGDFIRQQPDGLATHLGEDGVKLSGGQRQRLSIARALYHDPDVLVFDEATAALDTVTEAEVTGAIARLSGAKTVIAIAHRLSTLRGCDRIHVVDGGRIVAEGTYRELERTSPEFRKLTGGEGDP